MAILCAIILYGTSRAKRSDDESPALVFENRRTNFEESAVEAKSHRSLLNPAEFRHFRVLKVTKVSHNTKLIRFELPAGQSLGLPIGRHISVKAEIEGNSVIRAYTPTSSPDQRGYFDLLVKCYEFGKMSRHINSLRMGDSLLVRGPVGRFKFTKNKYGCMGFIAGGTGITPCLQVIRGVLESSDGAGDSTKFIILYQNRTREDILLKSEIDNLARNFPNRVRIDYYLSNNALSTLPSSSSPSPTKTSSSSSPVLIEEHLHAINATEVGRLLSVRECPFVGICGPSGFNEAMKNILISHGHDDNSVYIW